MLIVNFLSWEQPPGDKSKDKDKDKDGDGAIIGKRMAEEYREKLMVERGKFATNWKGETFERAFSLCEH